MSEVGRFRGAALLALAAFFTGAAPFPATAESATFGAQLDKCIGDENYIFVNADKARALVPEEFLVFGTASPLPVHETALFHYHAVHCESVTIGDTVLTDQTYVDFGVGVDPVDNDWMVTADNYYTLAFLVSSQEWADYLNFGGLPAQVATFDRTVVTTGVDPVPDLHVWTVSTPDVDFTFDFRLLKVPLVTANYHYSIWFGTGPFTRLDSNIRYGATILEAQMLLTDGTGPVADLTGPIRAGDASSYIRWDGPWSWVPGEFG